MHISIHITVSPPVISLRLDLNIANGNPNIILFIKQHKAIQQLHDTPLFSNFLIN